MHSHTGSWHLELSGHLWATRRRPVILKDANMVPSRPLRGPRLVPGIAMDASGYLRMQNLPPELQV